MTARLGCAAYGDRAHKFSRRNGRGKALYKGGSKPRRKALIDAPDGGSSKLRPEAGSGRRRLVDGAQAAVGEGEALENPATQQGPLQGLFDAGRASSKVASFFPGEQASARISEEKTSRR
ncbi:hypothetical protein DPX16_3432 [Anabarilius grahami]|uniref:Uncharacterized protein n=1 Tax=Anabarilius grahami TaxID=495550 RepID=A0A3N0Z1G1_ANAGA|nr:hypothetical protein DPX16_3432 [Anabarilius grahami]